MLRDRYISLFTLEFLLFLSFGCFFYIIASSCNLSKFKNQNLKNKIMKHYKCQLKLSILLFIKYCGIISRKQKVCGSPAGIAQSVHLVSNFEVMVA